MNRFTICQNIKKTYQHNCNDFVLAEIAEIELKFIALFMGLSGVIYLKNNRELLSELLFQIGYKSFLALTKISNAYRKIKNYFVSSRPVTSNTKKAYIYDEVKVIKNGVRHASFETMETFNESSYLGNPNDYYEVEEVVEETTSSSFDSDLVSSSSSSPSPHSSSSSCSSSSPSSSPSCQSSVREPASFDPLFIMEKNETNNTFEFKTFDFIIHTNYMYLESTETSKKNYTKIYRTFTENDFYVDKTAYETSNAEMIICNLEIDRDDTENETEYEIDLSQPYNFNVVGNLVLDEKFVHWYILKKYNYAIKPSANYKITCITKDIKTFELDRSSGLRVHLNDYEKIDKSSEFLRSTYYLHL